MNQKIGAESLELRYSRNPSRNLRNQIIEKNLGLVNKVARGLHARLPNNVEIDDLVSSGTLGLMDAIGKYNPDRGVPFKSFASYRIRGRMLDELRRMDWVPRLSRDRFRKAMAAAQEIEEAEGRPAMAAEVAKSLGTSVEKLADLMLRVIRSTFVSLSDPCSYDGLGQEVPRSETIANKKSEDPFVLSNRAEIFDKVFSALNYRDGFIIFLYYMEGLTLKDIGRRLGLCESRVCQIHTRSIKKLRGVFSEGADQ